MNNIFLQNFRSWNTPIISMVEKLLSILHTMIVNIHAIYHYPPKAMFLWFQLFNIFEHVILEFAIIC